MKERNRNNGYKRKGESDKKIIMFYKKTRKQETPCWIET